MRRNRSLLLFVMTLVFLFSPALSHAAVPKKTGPIRAQAPTAAEATRTQVSAAAGFPARK